MLRVALLVASCVAFAACVQSEKVTCADGRVCAPGYHCDDQNHRCLSADQVAACSGRDEGADCSFGGAPGACRMGACEPLVCGDGVRSIGEACDGTDLGGADCTTAGFYNPEGLACTEFCTFDAAACTGFCGDNVTNGDELCDGTPPQGGTCVDLGFDAGAVSCAASCGYSFATCGRFGWVPESSGIASAYGFSGTTATDLWLVGEDTAGIGVIAHHDGVSWTRTSTGSTDKLVAVRAISATDAWIATVSPAFGPSRPLRWNGSQWSSVTAAPLAEYTDIWAASPTAVFFATSDAGVQHFDGASFQALGAPGGPIVALRGAVANDLWAARADGTLVHWNGTLWMPIAVDVSVRHLAVISPSSVWVAGASTTSTAAAVAHWDGSMWTTYTDPSVAPDSFTAIVARADNDVWIAGPLGQARHFDGRLWTDSETRITTEALAGVIAMQSFGDLAIAAATNGFVHRYRGQMMAKLDPPAPNTVVSLWTSGPNQTFVGDLRGSVYRYNGLTWTRDIIDTTTTTFSVLAGSGPSDVWASGNHGRVHRWNGAWSLQTTLGSVNAIVASSPTDVWLFGAGVTHYDGGSFTPVTVAASGFQAASASGPNDLWALAPGTGTTAVAHYDGMAWTVTMLPHDMTSIVALAPDDVFATADNNHVLHFDGSTWTDVVVPVSTRLDHIAASAHDDVIATSPTEAVHFDGTRWTPLRLPPLNFSSVRAVAAAPGHLDMLVGGTSGQSVYRLIRTRFWSCRAAEAGCSDGVDDDCDGSADALDSDCP